MQFIWGAGIFIAGLVIGLFCACMAMAVDNEHHDPCEGCFGAANNDCDRCPHYGKGEDNV